MRRLRCGEANKGFVQAVTGCPPTAPLSYTHNSHSEQAEVCSMAQESLSCELCARPSRLGEGTRPQGEATLVSHLSKLHAEVILEQRVKSAASAVSHSLFGWLGGVVGGAGLGLGSGFEHRSAIF